MDIKTIILDKWMPAIITALCGGLLVALLAPAIQTHYAQATELQKRKVALWEKIGSDFTNYILYFDRLHDLEIIKQHSGAKKLPANFYSVYNSYLDNKNKLIGELKLDFALAGYYFDPATTTIINEFTAWKRQNSDEASVQRLTREDHIKWEDKIMDSIFQQLKN